MKKIALAFLIAMIVSNPVFSLNYDEVMDLLLKEKGGDIQYLSRINLGFPGGENWIAVRSDEITYVYTINDSKEVKRVDGSSYTEISRLRYFDPSIWDYVDLEYDILQHIPGRRIGSKAAKFWDFNGDGRDEIFAISRSNLADAECYMWGYDSTTESWFFPFSSLSSIAGANGPPPAGFYSHLGTEGIMIHGWDHMEERYCWDFYTWDEESRKYVREIEILEDDIDYSNYLSFEEPEEQDYQAAVGPAQKQESQAPVEAAVPAAAITESEPPEETGSQFYLIIILIIGVVALAVVIVLLAKRRKR